MERPQKAAVAATVVVALHAGLFYLLAPRLEGFTENPAAAVVSAAEGDVVPDITTPRSSDEALDVGFVAPSEEPEALPPEPLKVASEPKPEPPTKIEPEPVVPEPVAEKIKLAATESKPAPKLAPIKPVVAAAPAKPAKSAKPDKPAKLAAAKDKSTSPKAPTGNSKTPIAISTDTGYASRVRQHLARHAGALPPGAHGEARVQFVVQVNGRVTDVHLVKFSGNAGLDAVALNLPTQAQPLPLPGPTAQRLEVPVQAMASPP